MIELNGLTKRFGAKTAVDHVTFAVPPGAVFGFIGPNGAGKTTTIRLLMGLLHPTAGNATIDGLDCTADSLAVRARVGYLPDEVFLYDYLTGQQFLEFVADLRGLDPATARDRIAYYLDFFELAGVAGDYTVNYSFGMKKKLALASIVIHQPRVLILDEPFNGLDPQAVRNFRELMNRLVKAGTTILFSSHVLEVVEKLVSHIGIIDRGRLLVSGSLDEVVAPHAGSLEQAFFAHVQSPGAAVSSSAS
ncbi:MAG: ABC transporter ATP-binding protein [Candidatus Ozemobacter sibiricus]|jgi:ABC-2 type transport system ATP-binding protein|uniref:ABC transporter ATP-binding protein n=1 Tax=Candidatus Ozemobacter sibiricus TaxID=2268124 RepID=A0A367ZLL9_9BACT|nr:MAG: ABC transporter ATP-binding protein [Candidatus Ozemobacter sibiricus]